MTLLELVIIAHRCRSTHHFIAIDALSILKGKDAERWHDLVLRYHDSLLKGAKAPDKTFKDFKNHVLHVEEGEWGGARDAAMEWYGKAVAALRNHKWSDAVYALGVMTHYYADPIQPFHTAQSEEEGTMHRALEWSIAKSRDTIKAMIDARGYPTVTGSQDTGFVADMVLAGAKYSNPHYQTFIDHYDLDKGVQDPPTGLDQTLLDILADLIAYATAGVANLFERAFEEAAVQPPQIDLDLPGYLAALDIPIRKITKRMQDNRDRKTVEAMYEELQATGKVINTLPADDKKIRKLHAKQVLRISMNELDAQPLKPTGKKHVGLEKMPKPVEYVLKLVPVPVKDAEAEPAEPVAAAPIAPIVPDPVVFDPPEPVELNEAVSDLNAQLVETVTAVETADNDTEEEPDIEAEIEAEFDKTPEIESEAEIEATAELETTSEPNIEAKAEPEAEPEPEAELTPAEHVLAEIDAEEAEPETEIEPVVEAEAETETVSEQAPETKPEPKKEKSVAKPSKADRTDRLTAESPVVDAPSIGPKTAERLGKVDIVTIGDLLDANVEDTAAALNVRYITAKTLTDWQDQTRLMLEAPGLRVLDSQILVGAGIRNASELAKASARSVLKAATTFLETPSGSRVLWGAENTVDEGEVKQWIDLARTAKK